MFYYYYYSFGLFCNSVDLSIGLHLIYCHQPYFFPIALENPGILLVPAADRPVLLHLAIIYTVFSILNGKGNIWPVTGQGFQNTK